MVHNKAEKIKKIVEGTGGWIDMKFLPQVSYPSIDIDGLMAAKKDSKKSASNGKGRVPGKTGSAGKPGSTKKRDSQSRKTDGAASGKQDSGNKGKPHAQSGSQSDSGPAGEEPVPRALQKALERLERENARLGNEIKNLRETAREQKKQLRSLEGKLETRIKREELLMDILGVHSRTRKGQRNALSDLSKSLVKTDEHLLKLNKRMENVLSAIKNHREYLIRLNRRVYKENPVKLIDMELDVMSNTLNVMALSGFSIDKALFNDVKKIRKLMENKDMELAKLKKRMSTFTRKFDDELEKFDFESIYKKAEHIPGYR